MYFRNISSDVLRKIESIFPADIEKNLFADNAQVIGAYDEHHTLSGAAAYQLYQDTCQLLWISVREDLRGRGIGIMLLSQIIDELQPFFEIKVIQTMVVPGELRYQDGIDFFLRMGFLWGSDSSFFCQGTLQDFLSTKYMKKERKAGGIHLFQEMEHELRYQYMWSDLTKRLWGISEEEIFAEYDTRSSVFLVINNEIKGFILSRLINSEKAELSYIYIDSQYSPHLFVLFQLTAKLLEYQYGKDLELEMALMTPAAERVGRAMLPEAQLDTIAYLVLPIHDEKEG